MQVVLFVNALNCSAYSGVVQLRLIEVNEVIENNLHQNVGMKNNRKSNRECEPSSTPN